MKIVIIDYGMGNLFSVRRAVEVNGGTDIEVSANPARLAVADRVILPGVGAFVDGMAGLNRAGFVPAIHDYVATGRPLLGICLGMQMLMDESEEFGQTAGLGLIPGKVLAMERERGNLPKCKLPSIGWAGLKEENPWQGTPLENTTPGSSVYFLHSFHAMPDASADLLASYDYQGRQVTAAIRRGAVTGAQFHPEKSGPVGLGIMGTFLAQA